MRHRATADRNSNEHPERETETGSEPESQPELQTIRQIDRDRETERRTQIDTDTPLPAIGALGSALFASGGAVWAQWMWWVYARVAAHA